MSRIDEVDRGRAREQQGGAAVSGGRRGGIALVLRKNSSPYAELLLRDSRSAAMRSQGPWRPMCAWAINPPSLPPTRC